MTFLEILVSLCSITTQDGGNWFAFWIFFFFLLGLGEGRGGVGM